MKTNGEICVEWRKHSKATAFQLIGICHDVRKRLMMIVCMCVCMRKRQKESEREIKRNEERQRHFVN